MATKTLYFDESGYTGYNLLDPAQPVFAIASTGVLANTSAAAAPIPLLALVIMSVLPWSPADGVDDKNAAGKSSVNCGSP